VLFPTVAFAVFFTVAFVANWLLRPIFPVWLVVMTGLSLFFYGDAVPQFVYLLLGSAVVNWILGQAISSTLGPDRGRTSTSKNLVRLAVVLNLAVLGYFKYYGWFVGTIDAFGIHPPLVEVLLPIGISFFTFHALSYVLDIGRGEIRPMPLGDFCLYLSFFPHLVAGPIVRASEFAPQIRRQPDPRYIQAAEGFRLIVFGLFKKVVVSSYLATTIVDPVFGAPNAHGQLDLLIAVYAYAIQIYADFSGYTDIAIGTALLLGFRFPQNFDAPYTAASIQDFWRRWHMTLSRWLRDYLYIPLGGSRGSTAATYRNLFLTMVIGGFWHGAAWTFVVWGVLQGGFLCGERWIKGRWHASEAGQVVPDRVGSVLQVVLTFNLVCLAWIFFRADSIPTAFDVIWGILASDKPSELVTPFLLLVIGLSIASQFVPSRFAEQVQWRFSAMALGLQAVAFAAALTVIDVLGPDGVPPFIYFQF
jgi:alginate O-acetyltransferase complex protein AlgI